MREVHIVGGGIVGLCSAWYLTQAGVKVVVVDRGEFQDGTSFGNAGMIVPSHFIPMAAPGVIGQGLKWLLNSKSPFYVKPRLNLDLIAWLWKFHRSATHAHVERSMPHLLALNELSRELYRELAGSRGLNFGFEQRGLLSLFRTQKAAQEEEKVAAQAHKLGVKAELLNVQQLKKLEPEMELDVLGGLYFPEDAHLYPNRLLAQLIKELKLKGVGFLTNTTVSDFRVSGGKIVALIDADRKPIEVDTVLLTSGSWTAQLLKKVGVKMHLQDGKGYSVSFGELERRPKIPTLLAEAKVAITPMGDMLRIGGTLEISGLSPTIAKSRLAGIMESIPKYYKNLDLPDYQGMEVWRGYRPCTPDGLPYMGKSRELSNLIVGTGHGMMGLSLGAVSGKLLSEIAVGEKPSLDMSPYRLDRF